ncbi:alpha/beta hydrolase family protein [Litorimonas sp. RW-G-Af-16]|uniref:alpha/beta hydrolase family protein n=1 Tax=Litorimonas sp. RW-G-Af-16 TaxID=3241168 RepID=UPI00390C9557
MKPFKSTLLSTAMLAAAVFGASTVLAPQASAEPVTIESIAKHPLLSSVTISPTGKRIAALVPVEGQKWPVISIWETDNLDKKPVWIPTRDMRYLSVDFLTDDKILFRTDQPLTVRGKEDFTQKLYIADADGTNIEEPLKTQGTLNDAVRNIEKRFNTVGIIYNGEKFALITKFGDVYRLDKKDFTFSKVAKTGSDFDYVSGLVNPKTGELLGKQQLDNVGGDFVLKVYFRDTEDSDWVEHPALTDTLKKRQALQVVGFDGSKDKIVVLSNKDSEFVKAYSYNVKSKSFDPTPIFENPKYDILGVIMDAESDDKFPRPVGAVVSAGGIEVAFTDGYWAGVQKAMKAQFPKMDISIQDRSTKYKHAIISVSDERTPPSFFIWKDEKLTPLGNSRPWMNPEDSGKSRWISYTARDGLKIPAILTLPPNYKRSDGRVPTVVHPHGGPWARDFMGWDSSGWTQFMTSRGIAVIQPQYRGSTGLGKTLWYAGDMEWGQKMQDDKDDAAKFLVDQGIADPNKIAIFGYSYGGFAAIAASVRPNSPYRCAIAGAGVSSLDRIGNLWGSNRIVKERQAWTVKGMDPLKNVKNASIPILLYHGSGDRQADTVHSRDFYKAMKSAKKDVKYIEIDTMWHQLPWWPEWQTESLEAIEDYLASDKCGLI